MTGFELFLTMTDQLMDPFIQKVNAIYDDSMPKVTGLDRCEYTEPESTWGACDGGQQCTETATVYSFDADQELCPNHFWLAFAEWQREKAGRA